MRASPQPGELIDRGARADFTLDGRPVAAFEGDTIGSALAAAGTRTISRSFKYHRRRGLMCVAGRCPNCLVDVDGTPNVRACMTRAEAGMDVRSQNAWPSVELDALSALDRASPLMPAGFYYKTMHRPRGLWEAARPLVRRVAGVGTINPGSADAGRFAHRSVHAGVLVVGGGGAGSAAAAAAAEAGAQVVLADDQPHLGAGRDPRRAGAIARAASSVPGVEVLSDAAAFGFYPGMLVTVLCGREVLLIRAGAVVLATGAHEVPFLFPGNDLPGVMLASGALRLLRMYGVLAGARAVVATEDGSGHEAAAELAGAGVEIAAVLDARPGPAGPGGPGVGRVEYGAAVIRARGAAGVRSVEFAGPGGAVRSVGCDLLIMAGRRQPAAKLAMQAGCATALSPALGALAPTAPPAGVHLAGGVTGTLDPARAAAEGRRAGRAAALGEPAAAPGPGGAAADPARAAVPARGGKVFVCPCEDVTWSDVRLAAAEGFRDVQTLKRYTTATMGPCQGGMCSRNLTELAAAATGSPVPELGLTTLRPPVLPVPLGALAGPSFMPVKRTPLHHLHVSLGARMVDAGGWLRPHSYGDPAEEAAAVRGRVGVIDVSSLGKLDLRGPEAPRLMDFLYSNMMSTLRVGRVRYGIMCMDDGTTLDDGTVARLEDARYLVTTTTGNIELIEQWYRWWMETQTGMAAQLADVTAGLAAINVAGPMARATLGGLTDADLSPGAFRYMRSARARVAGVEAILLRIGFVGETGWEIHFPAEHAEHVWGRLAEAGRPHGIAPFGLEAQRILRLEKGHVIVNQDTDSVTTPLELGMDWAVRFSKEDFVGRGGLASVARRGPRHRVVGFAMDPESPVPPDGAPVVEDGSPVGRVTSGRRSPTEGLPFGLAMVPRRLASDGASVRILVEGDLWPARIRLGPLYDPAGSRLRG